MPQTLRSSFEQALRPLPSVVNASNAARQLRAGTQATALCCEGRSSLPFARPQMPQTLRGSFEQALRPLPSVVKDVQACRLPGLKCLKRCAAASSRHSGPLPSVVKGVQACRLPGLKCLKRCAAASSRHSGHCPLLLRAFKPAVCQASNASNAARQLRAGTQATALCC